MVRGRKSGARLFPLRLSPAIRCSTPRLFRPSDQRARLLIFLFVPSFLLAAHHDMASRGLHFILTLHRHRPSHAPGQQLSPQLGSRTP